jgi:hypothetical protein
MVNHSGRLCNIQEPQLSLIAHTHNSISIILQVILFLSNYLISKAVAMCTYEYILRNHSTEQYML